MERASEFSEAVPRPRFPSSNQTHRWSLRPNPGWSAVTGSGWLILSRTRSQFVLCNGRATLAKSISSVWQDAEISDAFGFPILGAFCPIHSSDPQQLFPRLSLVYID